MPPIKRHQALVQYSKEHHFGLLLGWKVRQGAKNSVEPERMAKYIVAAWEAEVAPHFDNEERELFGLLPTDDALRIQAEKEHTEIRNKIEEIKESGSLQNLEEFTTMLDAHIRFEERVLFPHIEKQQSFENFAKAMQAHEALAHSDFDSIWSDQFWK